MTDTQTLKRDEKPGFFVPSATYRQAHPSGRRELAYVFRCVHVATSPASGSLVAFGFTRFDDGYSTWSPNHLTRGWWENADWCPLDADELLEVLTP